MCIFHTSKIRPTSPSKNFLLNAEAWNCMFHISKLKALGKPETDKMKTAIPRIHVKPSCLSSSVSESFNRSPRSLQ